MKESLQEKSCHNTHKSSCGSFLSPRALKVLSQGDCPGEEEMSSVFRAYSELDDTDSRRLDLHGGLTVSQDLQREENP